MPSGANSLQHVHSGDHRGPHSARALRVDVFIQATPQARPRASFHELGREVSNMPTRTGWQAARKHRKPHGRLHATSHHAARTLLSTPSGLTHSPRSGGLRCGYGAASLSETTGEHGGEPGALLGQGPQQHRVPAASGQAAGAHTEKEILFLWNLVITALGLHPHGQGNVGAWLQLLTSDTGEARGPRAAWHRLHPDARCLSRRRCKRQHD